MIQSQLNELITVVSGLSACLRQRRRPDYKWSVGWHCGASGFHSWQLKFSLTGWQRESEQHYLALQDRVKVINRLC